MKFNSLIISVLLASFALFLTSTNSVATTEQTPPATQFYPFEGNWQGKAELLEPGKTPVKLDITWSCRKVSSGWAIACDMNAKNKEMSISESDLMGVDPTTGKGHWYAVTSMGETHDHHAEWTDANTMKAQHSWQQDGKLMEENVVFNINRNSINFRSVVSMDGQIAGEFSGSLKK